MNIVKQFWLKKSTWIPDHMEGWSPFKLVRDSEDQQLYWVWGGYNGRKVPWKDFPQGTLERSHTGCFLYEEDPL